MLPGDAYVSLEACSSGSRLERLTLRSRYGAVHTYGTSHCNAITREDAPPDGVSLSAHACMHVSPARARLACMRLACRGMHACGPASAR